MGSVEAHTSLSESTEKQTSTLDLVSTIAVVTPISVKPPKVPLVDERSRGNVAESRQLCFQKLPKQQQFNGFSCSGPTVRCNTVGCAEGQTFIATRRNENYRSCGLPCNSRGSQAAPLSALQAGAVVTPNAVQKHFSFPLWWTAM